MFCPHVLSLYHVHALPEEARRGAMDSLKLALQPVLKCLVDFGTPVKNPWKGS